MRLRIIRIPVYTQLAMYVCNCNAVTERQIRNAVRCGASTVRKLKDELGVASCCGKCAGHAREVIEGTLMECQPASIGIGINDLSGCSGVSFA